MRLFIASRAVIKNYRNIYTNLSSSLNGKWVEVNNLHLTWVFLGDSMSKDEAIERLSKISLDREPTTLKGLGYFGRPPRVLYIGRYSNSFEDEIKAFREAGFNMDRFKPHITLCRIKEIKNREKFFSFLKDRKNFEAIVSSEIALYSSQLTPKGAIYTKLWSLDSLT